MNFIQASFAWKINRFFFYKRALERMLDENSYEENLKKISSRQKQAWSKLKALDNLVTDTEFWKHWKFNSNKKIFWSLKKKIIIALKELWVILFTAWKLYRASSTSRQGHYNQMLSKWLDTNLWTNSSETLSIHLFKKSIISPTSSWIYARTQKTHEIYETTPEKIYFAKD